MQRTTLTIDGHSYVLARSTQLEALKASAEDAVRAGGRFVDMIVLGNVSVSVLVSPGVAIFLTTHEVPDDTRDTGDLSDPYDVQAEWDIAELI